MSSTRQLPPGVPVKNGKPDLPRGIRIRGKKLFVDKSRVIDGESRRFTATCGTYTEALSKATDFEKRLERIGRGELEDVPVKKFNWTLKRALDEIIRLPSPDGWAGTRGIDKQIINANDAIDYFGSQRPIITITRNDVDDYCTHLEHRGMQNSTINRKVSALSRLLAVAEMKSEGKYQKIKMPARRDEYTTRRRIFRLDEEAGIDEEKQILDYFSVRADRDAADVTAFALDTGMRNSEIWALQMSDVNFDQGIIEVKGEYFDCLKNRKTRKRLTKNHLLRVIPMTDRVKDILKRRRMSHGDKPFPFSNKWIEGKWNRMKTDLSIDDVEGEAFTFYSTRHTCCTRLLQRGVDVVRVQKWMGHKRIETTLGYIHLVTHDLYSARDVLQKAEGKDKAEGKGILVEKLIDLLEKESGQEAVKRLETLLRQL